MRWIPCRRFFRAKISDRVLQVKHFAVVFGWVGLLSAAIDARAQNDWRPEKTVEIVVPTAAGGGNDKTARIISKIWQESGVQSVVVNKTGGGGAVAYSYLNQHPGDAHHLAIAQVGFFTNEITGKSAIRYTDFSLIATLGTEPSAIAVRVDSPIKSAREFFDRLKQDPTAFSISVGSTMGGASHMGLGRAYKAIGGDPKRLKAVAFTGSAESVTALLGGHIDAMIGAINNVVPQVEAGKMRALAVTSARGLQGGFATVPTLRDLGLDVVQTGWTVVIAPRALTPAQVRYWEEMLAKVSQNNEWKNYLESNYWDNRFLRSQETAQYLARDYEVAKSALIDLGMAKIAK